MEPKLKEYEVVVVGGGIMGSSAAYFLSKVYGKGLLLVEQFDFVHKNGSSHGESRLIRTTYAQDHYTYLMPKAYQFWNDIEKEANTKLLTKTGGIDCANPNNTEFQEILSSAKKYKLNYELLTQEEVQTKFPGIRLPTDMLAIYTPDGGLLNANKCLVTLHSLARSKGCELLDNTEVTSITPVSLENSASGFRIEFKSGQSVLTKKCVITTGPWSQRLVKLVEGLELPLEVMQSTFSYWKVKDHQDFSSSVFPVILNYDDDGGIFPAHEYENMIKFATWRAKPTTISARDFQPDLDATSSGTYILQDMIPGIDEKPSMAETCLYTNTPDGDFVIDRLPSSLNLIVGCGFSGHGFKLAPVVGHILAELVISGIHPYPSVHQYFTINRFITKLSSSAPN